MTVRALVFAGNSFIGRWLCQRLREKSWSLTSTTRNGFPGTLACDLVDAGKVQQIIAQEQPDWIFQCAGATQGNDASVAYSLHVTGTMNVLEAVRRHSPGTGVMLLGSAAEYGVTLPEDLPVRETHPTIPHSFFGDSKLAQTQLGRTAAKLWGLRVISVRPFNVIGPGLPEHYFAAALGAKLRRLSLERGVRTFPLQNSNATRDFVDVRDVVEALVLLTELPASSSGTVFNICTGIETPLLQAARELGQLAGGFVPIPGDDAASRGGTIRSRGDSQLLRECTGWEPRYSWRESLLDMWKSLDALGKAA